LDPIGLVNYATAFVFSCALAYRANSFTFTPLTLVFGLATGISYAFGFVLVVAGMRLSGIVVTTAVIRLSMILPILFSVIVWNEEPNLWQTLGILVALVFCDNQSDSRHESTNLASNTKNRSYYGCVTFSKRRNGSFSHEGI
jgi:glucose uptake protein GlcU